MKSPTSRFVDHMNISSNKGHHRTSSSPLRFTPAYEDNQENVYMTVASRLSDSDSPNDQLYQHMFVNSEIFHEHQPPEVKDRGNCHLLFLIGCRFRFFDRPTIIRH